MRNQISGSISLDVSSLADAIAERLKQPATPALEEVDRGAAVRALREAFGKNILIPGDLEGDIILSLRRAGYVLAKLPAPTEQPADWFRRETD